MVQRLEDVRDADVEQPRVGLLRVRIARRAAGAAPGPQLGQPGAVTSREEPTPDPTGAGVARDPDGTLVVTPWRGVLVPGPAPHEGGGAR